jgi:hypothetical protein
LSVPATLPGRQTNRSHVDKSISTRARTGLPASQTELEDSTTLKALESAATDIQNAIDAYIAEGKEKEERTKGHNNLLGEDEALGSGSRNTVLTRLPRQLIFETGDNSEAAFLEIQFGNPNVGMFM